MHLRYQVRSREPGEQVFVLRKLSFTNRLRLKWQQGQNEIPNFVMRMRGGIELTLRPHQTAAADIRNAITRL